MISVIFRKPNNAFVFWSLPRARRRDQPSQGGEGMSSLDGQERGRLDIQGLLPPQVIYYEGADAVGQGVQFEGCNGQVCGPTRDALNDKPAGLNDNEGLGELVCFALVLDGFDRDVGEEP